MCIDPIADFLTRLRNAQAAHHEAVRLPSSKLKFALAKILEREGYVKNVQEHIKSDRKTIEFTIVYLGKVPYIRSLERVSKPGRRVYRRAHELPHVLSDQGIAIVSTSAGLMTNKEARRRKLGGEVLCEIY